MRRLPIAPAVFIGLALALGSAPALEQAPDAEQGAPGTGSAWQRSWRGARIALLGKVADALGMERSDVLSRLIAGETVADIAGGRLDDVVDTLLAPRLERQDKAAAESLVTSADADELAAFWRADLDGHLSHLLPFQFRLRGLHRLAAE